MNHLGTGWHCTYLEFTQLTGLCGQTARGLVRLENLVGVMTLKGMALRSSDKLLRLQNRQRQCRRLDMQLPLFHQENHFRCLVHAGQTWSRERQMHQQPFSTFPKVIHFNGSKLHLCGMVLWNKVHFILVAKLKDCFVLYDGLKKYPHCEVFPLSISSEHARNIQGNYGLSYLLYEVISS
jgi:hypothetical protein